MMGFFFFKSATDLHKYCEQSEKSVFCHPVDNINTPLSKTLHNIDSKQTGAFIHTGLSESSWNSLEILA